MDLARSFVVFVSLGMAGAGDRARADGEGKEEIHLLSFAADAVDGVDVLILKDGVVAIEHRQWRPIEGLRTEVVAPLPPAGEFRVVVRNRVGRPRVDVIEQPLSDERVVRVRIDDGPSAGAAPLTFDLYALPARRAPNPSNVLVVTIDSLRADRLGCYGYARPTSPNLDRFAKQCVRFEHAFSTSSFTPPSHASLLTSRYVSDHGLYTWNRLDPRQVTLAEVLAVHDYRTGASVNLALLSDQNLGQGFGWRREGARDARAIVSEALEFIRAGRDQPFFVWLHLYDVHRPYGRTGSFTSTFAAAARPGVGDVEQHYNLTPGAAEERGLGEDDLHYIIDRYDAGIRYVDAELEPLLAELSTRERRADTLVVITADHGESLLDHEKRSFTHDPFLYTAVTRVPLFIRYPDGVGGAGAGTTRDHLVSLIDVAPTILGVLGIAPPPTFDGVDLRQLEDGRGGPRGEVFMECYGWETLKAARTRERLIVRDMTQKQTRFFDVVADPGELRGVAQAPDPGARALLDRLIEFATRRPEGEGPPALDPDVIRRLKELGYIED